MHYEHLVQINDPSNLLVAEISAEQLWRGLMYRATDPGDFVLGLEDYTVLESGEGWMRREFYLGALKINDHVTFSPPHSIQFVTAPSAAHGGGRLTMRIESPEASQLFVRFTYDTALDESAPPGPAAEDAYFAPYVKAAYRDADIETIRKLRVMIEAGEFG